MVLINVKRAEESLFLAQVSSDLQVKELAVQLTETHNLRKKLERLVASTRDLLEYGPLKKDSEQGYTEDQIDELGGNAGVQKPRGTFTRDGFEWTLITDPTGRRLGEGSLSHAGAGHEAASVVNQVLEKTEQLISKDRVASGHVLQHSELTDALLNIKAAITIIYPAGLPEWDPVQEIFDGTEDLTGTAASKEVFTFPDVSLWWANKELQWEKKLKDYVGSNEKTKIVVKIQRKGQGAPLREPRISEQEQKNMMAFYYRKQEEQKRLDENDEDDYLNSRWADPKSLKKAFTGMADVKWRGF